MPCTDDRWDQRIHSVGRPPTHKVERWPGEGYGNLLNASSARLIAYVWQWTSFDWNDGDEYHVTANMNMDHEDIYKNLMFFSIILCEFAVVVQWEVAAQLEDDGANPWGGMYL